MMDYWVAGRRLLLLLILVGSSCRPDDVSAERGRDLPVQVVQAGEIALHYVSAGHGAPVVLVPGGLEDYRAWTAQLGPLAKEHFRAIAYSRRYDFPNRNLPRNIASYSAKVDAKDLARLLEKLKLGPVHLVGHSYGGLGALFFATEHPELVRSLTLSEPPLPAWVKKETEGAALAQVFWEAFWRPLGRALAQGAKEKALSIAGRYFTGGANVPADVEAVLTPNLREWEVLTRSTDAFPVPSDDSLRRIKAPVLLLTGDHSLPLLQRSVREIGNRLPGSRQVTIRNAAHDMWREKPSDCGAALRHFLHTVAAH